MFGGPFPSCCLPMRSAFAKITSICALGKPEGPIDGAAPAAAPPPEPAGFARVRITPLSRIIRMNLGFVIHFVFPTLEPLSQYIANAWRNASISYAPGCSSSFNTASTLSLAWLTPGGVAVIATV